MTADSNRSPIRGALVFALIVLTFLGAIHSGLHARWAHTAIGQRQISVLPDNEVLGTLSLGYRTFWADVIWVRALQYRDPKNQLGLVPRFADAMLYLDPEFEAAYRWAANNLVFADGISQEGVTKANEYLERGMNQFPKDPYYPYTIGTNWALFYPERDAEQKRRMKDKGIDYLQIAMQMRSSPTNIPMLIAGLMDKSNTSAKLDFLEQAYVSESDPEVKRTIERRIASLGDNDRERAFERLKRQRSRWVQANYPFVQPGLAYQFGRRAAFFR